MLNKNFFELPEHILADILTSWLAFRCLPRLDVAQCNRRSRPSYLAALKFEGTVYATFPCRSTFRRAIPTVWVTDRTIKVRSFYVDNDIDIAIAGAVFCASAQTLEEVTFTGADSSRLLILIKDLLNARTQRLARVKFSWCDAFRTEEFAEFIDNCSQTLEMLVLRDSLCRKSVPLPGLLCRLHTLFLDNSHQRPQAGEIERHIVGKCPNLVRLVIYCAAQHTSLMRVVAAHCPRLQQLHVGFYDYREDAPGEVAAVGAVLQTCLSIHTLEMITWIERVEPLAQYGGNLTALRLCGIPDTALAQLLPALASLRHLAVDHVTGSTDTSLLSFAPHFGQLKSLSMNYHNADVSETALCAAIAGLVSVTDLRLHVAKQGWITDTVLCAVASHCKQLRILKLLSEHEAEEYCYTAGGLSALLAGWPVLTEVFLSGHLQAVPASVRSLRPDVTFYNDVSWHAPCWSARGCDWRYYS